MTRSYVRYGASPRGAQTLISAAKIRALLESRMNVSYDDVQAMAMPALRHRILLNFDAEATGVSADSVIARVIEAVPTTGF
jgi:MoxR-like ATPase